MAADLLGEFPGPGLQRFGVFFPRVGRLDENGFQPRVIDVAVPRHRVEQHGAAFSQCNTGIRPADIGNKCRAHDPPQWQCCGGRRL